MSAPTRAVHDVVFTRSTEWPDCWLFRCEQTGATGQHWPNYLRAGDVLTVFDEAYHPCSYVEHRKTGRP